MEVSEYILLLLSAKPAGIDGRTAVQKLGYFISVVLGKDFGYGPDFYGPYSPVVQANLQNLVETDFAVERRRLTNRYRKMYSYSLTDEAMMLAKDLSKKHSKESKTIFGIVKKCDQVVHLNYNVLSWAAKVHFVLSRSGKAMTYDEAIASSRKFGWKLSEQEVEAGAKLLQELKLIKKN